MIIDFTNIPKKPSRAALSINQAWFSAVCKPTNWQIAPKNTEASDYFDKWAKERVFGSLHDRTNSMDMMEWCKLLNIDAITCCASNHVIWKAPSFLSLKDEFLTVPVCIYWMPSHLAVVLEMANNRFAQIRWSEVEAQQHLGFLKKLYILCQNSKKS